jgi:magnesium-protoporphyrin O-methyltransferase
MNCQCEGIEQFFDSEEAERNLRSYQKNGPHHTTQVLLDAIRAEGVDGKTVLDIGGGIGAIQHELLKAGAASAVSVDASSAYIRIAKAEAERQGIADHVTYHHGNFVELTWSLENADVVTLDRVICCYDEMESLVTLSARRAGRLYGVVYPRKSLGAHFAIGIANLWMRIKGNPFRAFVHDPSAIRSVIEGSGLRLRFAAKTLVWHVELYAR